MASEPVNETAVGVARRPMPTRPCRHCGDPVPQNATGRPLDYCRDKPCQARAKEARAARRAAGGITGTVAAVEELIERRQASVDKEQALLEQLAASLRAELTPAGVQAARSKAEADAAARVAAAQAAAEQVRLAADQRVADANADRDAARTDAEAARDQRDAAARAQATAEERARAAEATAAAERERAERATAQLTDAAAAHAAQLATANAALAATQRELDQASRELGELRAAQQRTRDKPAQ